MVKHATSKPSQRILKKPAALSLGDSVAVICPAGWIAPDRILEIEKWLRRSGFCVVPSPYRKFLTRRRSAFAASDSIRAQEFLWAIEQPGLKAVFAARGGYGSVRTLAELKLEPQKIRSMIPKILVGFSDITYLHQWIQNELGWVSFHGPLVTSINESQLRQMIRDLLNLSKAPSKELWSEVKTRPSRRAVGRLVGGTLSLLQVAGAAALPKEPSILVLEDIHEAHYRIDRMIWQLIDSGYSEWIRGIILGKFHRCGTDDRKRFSWAQIEKSLRQLTRGPIWQAARFGHGVANQRILPLGIRVALSGKKIEYLENLVSRD